MMIDVRTPEGLLLGRVSVPDWARVGLTVPIPPTTRAGRAWSPQAGGVIPARPVYEMRVERWYEMRVERWIGPSVPRGVPAIKWTGSLAELREIEGFEEHVP